MLLLLGGKLVLNIEYKMKIPNHLDPAVPCGPPKNPNPNLQYVPALL
jgi:hypothetical protein